MSRAHPRPLRMITEGMLLPDRPLGKCEKRLNVKGTGSSSTSVHRPSLCQNKGALRSQKKSLVRDLAPVGGGCGGCGGLEAAGGGPGHCVEHSRKETLSEDTASTACTSLHMCYFQLDGEQAKFSNRLSFELKSSSPPPPCPAPTACRHGEAKCTQGTSLCPVQSIFPPGRCTHTAHTLPALPLPKSPLVARPQGLTLLGGGQRLHLLPFPLRAGPGTGPSILPNPSPLHHGLAASPAIGFAHSCTLPPALSLLFFQAENIPPSFTPQIPPPATSPLPHHCDPSRSAAAFAAVSLPCLKCRKEIHVQLTVSAPCNHFVSRKALLSNPHRQTGRGWIGERHLTPLCGVFSPLFSSWVLLYGWDERWVFLSFPSPGTLETVRSE